MPPESHRSAQLSRRSAHVRFESLAAHIAQLSSGGHILLAGDFNARVGAAAQPWVTDLSDDASAQLQNSDSTVNGHGRKLLHLCDETAMVLCTGRTPGDQPSFKARSDTTASCLDHALVDCGLFASVQACCIGSHRQESDHCWVCSSLCLLHQHHCPQPRPPFPTGFGTAISEGPTQVPLHQGRARPSSMAA